MLCQNVRQILARSSDAPSLVDEGVIEHLLSCPGCRRDEFYHKQVSKVGDLVFPYEVSSNFNFKLQVKLANSPKLEPLAARLGIRRQVGWYVAMGFTGAFAVLTMFAVSGIDPNGEQSVNLNSLGTENPIPALQEYKLPIPVFGEIAQASERPNFRFTPESPVAAQYASASSEPFRPGVDGEALQTWEESWVWVGDTENGYFVPVRRYQQSSAGSEQVLLLPASSTSQSVNIVY